MKILFLHGWTSRPGGVKPSFLRRHVETVLNPALPDDDFDAAVAIATEQFRTHQPDVVVGSSRGGAVAMNMESGDAPLVLLCPAWRFWGTAHAIKSDSVVLHSREDEIVPFTDSEELIKHSRLPDTHLIEVGTDHRLADPASLQAMLDACQRFSKIGRTGINSDQDW